MSNFLINYIIFLNEIQNLKISFENTSFIFVISHNIRVNNPLRQNTIMFLNHTLVVRVRSYFIDYLDQTLHYNTYIFIYNYLLGTMSPPGLIFSCLINECLKKARALLFKKKKNNNDTVLKLTLKYALIKM